MLRLLVTIPQVLVATLAGYNAVTALWGWRNRRTAAPAPPRSIRVVIPAHNEEAVIGNLVGDLMAQTHPSGFAEVVVLADRCTDGTGTAASPARVVERKSGREGKGLSLAWYLDREPLDSGEVLLVIDADNRVPTNLLGRVSDEIADGHAVVQVYLDSTNPGGSPMAMAYAMSYWAGNRMVQLARSNLGWSADLGGTGMALTAEALAAVGGFGDGLAEDQDLGVRLALAGEAVEWLHDVRIYDEKPNDTASAVRQRARWMTGRRQVARRYLGSLWRRAIEQRSIRLFDVGVRLVQPGRSFIALVSGVFTIAALATRSRLLFPWQIWAAIAAVQVLEPIPFLARDGVPGRLLIRYPLLTILAVLWLPIRVASSIARGWGHTRHIGEVKSQVPSEPDRDRAQGPTEGPGRTTGA